MVTLHIYLQVEEDKATDFEQLYWHHYVPAIRTQEGFIQTSLLHSMEAADKYEIDIVFTSEELRQKWAEGPEHASVWPLMEEAARGIHWEGYDVLTLG